MQQVATMLDLLSLIPILDHLASYLPFAGLPNLYRVNSSYRAVLHGFPPAYDLKDAGKKQMVRESLRIGYHDADLRRHLKSVVAFECSWPAHKKGENVLSY